jgi:hypothetical protein
MIVDLLKSLPSFVQHPRPYNNKIRRRCPQCDKPIIGRLDKRFCDAYCRNTYNNRVKREDEQYIKDIYRILRRNRRILKTLSPQGKATVRKDVLEQIGYDFRYFSATYHSPKLLYYICYDFGFAPVIDNGKEKAMIIQKQNYMDPYALDPWKK